MSFRFLLLLCVLPLAVIAQAPVWPDQYHVNGTFSLPYFNISIPVDINFDGINNRETISYYYGMDTYVWRFDIETLYEVVPRIDTLVCFTSSGIGSGPMITLLPNMSLFQMMGMETINNIPCQTWQMNVTNYNKTSVYTMYINDVDSTPVQFILKGYDYVFGSHPDVYILDYFVYEPDYVNNSTFDKPSLCASGSENTPAGTLRSKANLAKLSVFTPVQADDAFGLWMSQHKKWYTDSQEYAIRRSIWEKNIQRINEHNSKPGVTFKLAMNHLGDYTDEEIQMLLMPKRSPQAKADARAAVTGTHVISGKPLPSHIDWVDRGAVTPIKDQGICGSCWTFGTAGSIEGAWFISSGDLIEVSEQQILDCAWDGEDSGCDGGEAFAAMQWIMDNHGLATEQSYPYLSQDHYCAASERDSGIKLTGYVNVTGGEHGLKDAVATMGPVAIAIDAAHPEFEYYSSGVYYNPACKNGIDDLDHEVLVVGYGKEDGQDYWLVKNSWSTHWGNNGYIKMARNRGNNCGIATDPNYPIV